LTDGDGRTRPRHTGYGKNYPRIKDMSSKKPTTK
jgi:hypothetical protein